MEVDKYDHNSTHFLIRTDNTWTGTVRLMHRKNRKLPIETLFDIVLQEGDIEVSRLSCIRHKESYATLSKLVHTVLSFWKDKDYKTTCLVTNKRVANILTKVGIPLIKYNDKGIQHKGIRYAYIVDMEAYNDRPIEYRLFSEFVDDIVD